MPPRVVGELIAPPHFAAAASAVSVARGNRTRNVLPLSPAFFQQRISPPCARTNPVADAQPQPRTFSRPAWS